MKRSRMAFLFLLIFVMTGCGDNDNWIEAEEEFEEVESFMLEYMEAWKGSIENQSFSVMEKYFVPNSTVYHMQRRQHQEMVSSRKKEEFIDSENETLEKNQYDEYKFTWKEHIKMYEGDSAEEQARTRSYYLSRLRGALKITVIERKD